ncbi:fasciclin-like arabinogalactan protein 9 [Punica granatum]|uniref:FAS1 domain-containing protein n=2 Tax=Punica granatum TaxID=22663 RepID=A0A218VV18_PUNGR|nr:fasciclin-like arabinogalactan protein 9 [Punica granatum]OWM64335.1 hypothetical protein CDL15_Pgr010126 [Punica granatum]PKI56647.1 hypothetical protein CRG98_022959 [Punica granatum]
MASSQFILLALICSILLLLAPSQTLAQSPSAPAPAPSGPVNFTGILDKGGQFKTLIHLMTVETQVAKQIENQLNTSSEGLTVFAPTDNAFNNLKSGTLNDLSTEKQVQLLLYHVLPKYYTLQSLVTVSNPVRTQANYGLNFTGQANTNQVNVSSGLVNTQVNNALYQQMPLAVYQVDKVLLPAELFEASAPSNSPPAPATKSNDSNSTTSAKGPTSSDNSDSGASQMNLWSGMVVGIVAICMGTLL